MDTPKFYVAHAMVFDEDNRFVSLVFCGLFHERLHAYKNISNTMAAYPNAKYIPIVKLGEVLDDAEDNTAWDWPIPFVPEVK